MSTWSKPIAIVALIVGLLAVAGGASAAIVITDSNATSWLINNGAPLVSADGAMSGTESFTITANPTNSVLIVNYTQVAQTGGGGDAITNISWNGTPLTRAISQISANSSQIYAEQFYLFNPTPAVSGSLVVSSSGRAAVFNAYTLSGVNPFLPPATYGKDSNSNTTAVTTSATTAAGSFASIVGAWRVGTSASGYVGASGPSISKLWTTSGGTDQSNVMSSVGAYVPSTTAGALTITQTASTNGSRNEIAVAVFSAPSAATSIWAAASGGSWNTSGNWGSGVPSGTGAAAWFLSNSPTAPAAVTLDTAITLNSLGIWNSNQITIAPGIAGSLTFAASGSTLPILTDASGSHVISAPISLNANTTFSVYSGQTLNISGNIANGTSASGIIVPAGNGTLILGGINSYSGITSVAGGVVNVTSSLGNTPLVVSGGAVTVTGSVGSAPVVVSGGTVSVGGNLNSTSVAVSGGSVTVAGALQGSGSVSVTGGSLTIAGALVGNNSISMSGGVANLNVNGNSPVSLSGGALNLSGSLGNSPPISMTGGSLSLQTSGEIGQNQLTISGGTSAVALLVETAGNAITGSTALSVSGNALAILSQANNYTGPTTVNGGTLDLAMPSSLYGGSTANWTPANITVSNSGVLAVHIGGPNDFTQPQAALLLANLSASTSSSGLGSGVYFGLDTTNATATVTYSEQIADTTAGPLGFTKRGTGTLVLSNTNSYSGPTVVANGELIMTGANTAGTVATLSAVNNVPSGVSVLSIRNVNALGSGTANGGLAPITLNATGGNNANSINDTAILEIGAKIGTDPGPYNADFSYQVVAPGNGISGTAVATNVVAGNGQINLGFLGNNNDGTGFAAYNANSLSTPRIVALYTPVPGSTTLATIREKYEFGQGGGDHLTLGSPTANNTLVLENPVDLNGGASRQFVSIRGVGIVPEGEYAGAIVNSATTALNISFNGNGGLIFDSPNTSYNDATFQVNGGAVFVAANDPAQGPLNSGPHGALGIGTATFQLGTGTATNPAGGTPVPTVAGANVAFMTYGPNAGIGLSPTIFTNRIISVGGSDVTYANATLGGMTDDWTQMNGGISLNEPPAIPTTFTARNGGRVDFGGIISGSGSVVVGNSIVEGDATTPGIAVNNNGIIVFTGQNSYTGPTTVSAGKLYVDGAIQSSSLVTVSSAATLGGMGSISSPVNVSSGGILEGGHSGTGSLTLNSGLTLNGPASFFIGGTPPQVGFPALQIFGTLNANGNQMTINIASLAGTGDYALIGYNGIQSSSSSFTLGTLPNRAAGTLAFDNGANELDLNVTSVAAFILWSGSQSSAWNTSASNWVFNGSPTAYIDSPGDSVLFDDTAAPRTSVTINGADVHPSSVTFNNNNSTFTISGTNAIAGSTGLQLTGTGTVVLLNTNTYTGATSIGAGATLQLGNGVPGSDGSISRTGGITDNGTLIYNLAGAQSYGGAIGGAGSLTLHSGMLTLTGSETYSGATTINSGTLQLGVGAVNKDGTLTGDITNNAALVFNYFGNQTYAGAISGSGAVTKNGLGTLTLGGFDSFSGATQLNEGGLQLASQSALQNSMLTMGPFASLSFAGGVTNFSVGGLAGSGGISLTDSLSGPVALTVSNSGPNTVFSGTISGTGSLTQAGPNSLTLSGTNSYSGGTTISGGTLAITNANSLGAVGGALNIGAATLEVAGNIATGRNISLNDPAATIQVDASQSYNNSGVLSGGGNLNKTGAGLLVLAGTVSNPFTTAVSGGTLLANGPSIALGTVTVVAAVFGGNASAGDTTVLNGGTIDVSANNFNNGSTLSLSSLTLGQSATDTATLNFSAGNPARPQLSIAGALTANGGNNSVTVNVGAPGALVGIYTLATYNSLLGTGSSAFVLGSQSALTTRENGALVVTGTAIDYVLTGNYPIWRGVNDSNWVTANNWVRSDNGAPTTFIPGDTVVFDDSAGTTAGGTTNVTISGTADVSPSSVTFNNNAYNYTVSGPFGITGAGPLTLNGTGSVTLSTTNTYSGGTFINAGTLIASNSSGVATGSGPVNIFAGGTLIANNSGGLATGSSPLNINGGTLIANNSSGTATGSGPLNINAGGLLMADNSGGLATGSGTVIVNTGGLLIANNSGGTATGSSPVNINGGTLQIGNGNANGTLGAVPVDNGVLAFSRSDSVTYASTITGTGSVVQHGPGLLTLTATNSSFTSTTVNGGTLSISNGNNLGPAPANVNPTSITINNATLQIAGTTAFNTTTLSGNRGITLISSATINAPILPGGTFNVNEAATQYVGVITGSGNLSITGGTGTNSGAAPYLLELGGSNTYTGNTTVSNIIVSLANGANGGTGPNNILPTTTVLNLINNGWFVLNNGTANQTLAGLTGDATAVLGTTNQGAAANLTIDPADGQTYNFAGVIGAQTILGRTGSDARLTVTISGQGTQILSGSSTYSGGTTVDSGTLQLGNNAALGTGGLTANGGGTDLHGFNPTVSSLSGSAGLITNNGASNSLLTVNQGTRATTFGGTISDGPTNKVALTLITSGTGVLVLDGSNTYSGATTISGSSTLQLGNNDNNGSIGNSTVTDNGSLVVSRSDSVNLTSLISGSLGGSGSLVLNGSGTLTLTGTNTYSGGTAVDAGTMIVTNPEAIPDGTSLIVGDPSGFAAPIVPAPVAGSAAAAVPEPGTLALVAATALSIGIWRRKGGRKTCAKRPDTGC